MIVAVRPKTCEVKQPGDRDNVGFLAGGRVMSYMYMYVHLVLCCVQISCHQTVFRTNESQKLATVEFFYKHTVGTGYRISYRGGVFLW